MPIPRLLSLAEAAELIGVHRITLDRERQRGHLRFVKIRNRVLIPQDELANYLNRNYHREETCSNETSSTGAIGSGDEKTPPISTSTGANLDHDASAARARTRMILRKPKPS